MDRCALVKQKKGPPIKSRFATGDSPLGITLGGGQRFRHHDVKTSSVFNVSKFFRLASMSSGKVLTRAARQR
jgi:hypothetical protein